MRTVEKLHFNTEEDCKVVRFSEDMRICPDNTFIGDNNCSVSIVHTPIPSRPNNANNLSTTSINFPSPNIPHEESVPLSSTVKPRQHPPRAQRNVAKNENTSLLFFMIKFYSCLLFQSFISMCFALYCSLKLEELGSNSWLLKSFYVSLSILLVVLIAILLLNKHLRSYFVQCFLYLMCTACFVLIFGYLELMFKHFRIVGFLVMYQMISLIQIVFWIWKKHVNLLDHIRIVVGGTIAAFVGTVGIFNQIAVSIVIEALFLLFFFSFAMYESYSLGQGRLGFKHEDYFIGSQMVYIDIFGAIYELVIRVSNYIF